MSDTDEPIVTRMVPDPEVWDKDQARATALDALRKADTWVVLIPHSDGTEAHSVSSLEHLIYMRVTLEELIRQQLVAVLDEDEAIEGLA